MDSNRLQFLTCKSGYSVLMPVVERTECTQKQMDVLSENWGKIDYKEGLSQQAQRRLAHILTVWHRTLMMCQGQDNLLTATKKRQLIFITLTLSNSQVHSDNEIKRKMLNRFLNKMAKKYSMINWLWKAEKQKNGNIHFHIVTDVFVKKEELNYLWDSIQYDYTYVKKKPIWHKEYSSPSTRIELITGKDGIAVYMSKYVGKDEQNGKVEGRKWGCSKAVRELEDYQFPCDSDIHDIMKEAVESGKVDYNVNDFFVVFSYDFFFMIMNRSDYHRNCANMVYYKNYNNLYKSGEGIASFNESNF